MRLPFDRSPLFALPALLLFTSACLQAAPTHLRGHVTSHLTGQPLNLAFVTIYAADGSPVPGFAGTDAGGAYAWSGDCPDSGRTCIAKLSVNPFSNGGPYETLQAHFTNGSADAVIDFAPHALGSITAALTGPNGVPTVTSALEPSTSLAFVVFAFDANAQSWQRLDPLEISYQPGLLTARSLPEGRYRVCAGGIDLGLQRQCFDHKPAAETWAKQAYTDIDLTEGEQRTLQFDLLAGGSISGELIDTYKNQPLSTDAPNKTVRVALYDSDGMLFDHGTTNFADDSNFHVSGTPKGTFRIETGMFDRAYREQFVLFPAIPCPDGVCPLDRGTPIQTDVAGNVGGIDLALHPSVVIRGRVTDVDTHLPVSGALVSDTWYFIPNFNEAPPIPTTHNTHTDTDGNYAVYAPTAPPVYLRASGTTYLPTCSGFSTCVGWVTDSNTLVGDLFIVDIALQLGGTFSGTLRDVLGQDTAGTLSIYDSNGNWVYSLGDELAYVTIDGAYRSPALPAGTYYAMAEGVQGRGNGACQIYAARKCPYLISPQALLNVAPTPIEIIVGEDHTGVDFTVVLDHVFTDGFEQYF